MEIVDSKISGLVKVGQKWVVKNVKVVSQSSVGYSVILAIYLRAILYNSNDIQYNVIFTIYRVNLFWSHIHQKRYSTVDCNVLAPLNNKNVSGMQKVHPSASSRNGLIQIPFFLYFEP